MADTILPPPTGPTDALSLSVEPHRFAIVPEWVLDANISDAAVRLYAVLARYGGTSGRRMPSRATLAARLGKKSVDTIDRALRELEALGAVEVERRTEGGQKLTNRYHLRTSQPRSDGTDAAMIDAATSADAPRPLPPPATAALDGPGPVDNGHGGDRTDAATPSTDGQVVSGSPRSGSRNPAATSHTDAARVAAPMRHDRESSTQREPSPSLPAPRVGLVPATAVEEEAVTGPAPRRQPIRDAAGIDDLDALSAQLTELRRSLGKPTGRWTTHCLHAAIALTVQRGWPAEQVRRALFTVASDPTTVSPMRLAEAGPWWDEPTAVAAAPADEVELAELEARLDATDGQRVHLQRHAREQLTAEGMPLTRATVLRRAAILLADAQRGL